MTVDFDFDFGDDPGHGPYFTFPTHQGYDDTYNRVYDYTDITASSSTGAPANVYLEDGDYWLVVRIGDENQGNISGKQTYVLTYTVHHVMNAVTDAVVPGESTRDRRGRVLLERDRRRLGHPHFQCHRHCHEPRGRSRGAVLCGGDRSCRGV